MKSILTSAIVIAASRSQRHGAAAAGRMLFQSHAPRATASSTPGFLSIPSPTITAQQQFRRRTAATTTSATFGSTPRLASSSTNQQDSTVAVVDEMPPPLPPLKNHYYLLRHGQSTANVQGIISSARSLAGSTKHGLTLLGIQQGKDSAVSLVDMIAEDLEGGDVNSDDDNGMPESTRRVYFYSSPFARAKETAVACLLGLAQNEEASQKVAALNLEIRDDVLIDDGLMERYFGRLDGMELGTYAYVWPVDMFEPTHTAFDVESVAAVSARIRSTLLDIDSKHSDPGGNHIVLTSHADVLQITQVYAAGLDNVAQTSLQH